MGKIRGIRGATSVNENTSGEILSGTRDLLNAIITENGISVEDIASIFFSVTKDLDAEFPAKAARDLGMGDTPLLCLNEIAVPSALQRCIRILLHVNTEKKQSEIKHIYLREAVKLRPDHQPNGITPGDQAKL